MKFIVYVTPPSSEQTTPSKHTCDGKCTSSNIYLARLDDVLWNPDYLFILNHFYRTCKAPHWCVNGLTRWRDVDQLWFWSSRSLVWDQTDQCEGGFAAARLLHLIPGCITQPGQSNSTQTRGLPPPSKDVEEYSIASCTTEVISLLQPHAKNLTWITSHVSKPHCAREHAKSNLS